MTIAPETTRTPVWDRLDTTTGWDEGGWAAIRANNHLDWEVEEDQAYGAAGSADAGDRVIAPVPNYKHLFRSDVQRLIPSPQGLTINPQALLSVQPVSYKTISNERYFEAMDFVMGKAGDDFVFEKAFQLYGGRQIVVCLKATSPLDISGDPSKTYEFIVFVTRHDGNGGLKGIPMQMRMFCANMLKAAERGARGDKVGFTIKHTLNWELQLQEAAKVIAIARRDAAAWQELANRLVLKKISSRMTARQLEQLFPINENVMTDRQMDTAKASRSAVRTILASPTCEGIAGTAYGLTQAVVEWADHVRPAHSAETRASRSVLQSEPTKQKAFALARSLLS